MLRADTAEGPRGPGDSLRLPISAIYSAVSDFFHCHQEALQAQFSRYV